MYPHKQRLDLPELRRQLEELLAMVTADLNSESSYQSQHVYLTGSGDTPQNDRNAEPDTRINSELDTRSYFEPDRGLCTQPKPNDSNEEDDRDPLFDDALVVITEFGHASAAIIQMWLSIDYGRASKILSQFQADGLISAKGRVRHKAFVLRHSLAAT
jgi:DNA segregation ATPase FtsK/SpoIIIE-like protein